MKKLLIISAVILLSGCGVTKFTEYYATTGGVMQTGQYKKHLLEGEVLTYYTNGQLWKREHYKAGELDGVREYYYEDYAPEHDGTYRPVGQLQSRMYYAMGFQRGKEVTFHRNGQMEAERYHSEEPTIWREWDEDGNLCFEGDYINGEGHGTWTYYRPDGSKGGVMELSGGNRHGVYETFYPNGDPSDRQVYDKGVLIEWIRRDENGNRIDAQPEENSDDRTEEHMPHRDSLYKIHIELQRAASDALLSNNDEEFRKANRALDEFMEKYEEDFLDFFIAMFSEDQRDGEFYEYYATGEIKLATQRAKGEHHGMQRVLYKDGSVARSAEYKHNLLDGPVRGFYRNGTPEVEGQMSQGNRVGIWKLYNPDGSLRAEMNYDKSK